MAGRGRAALKPAPEALLYTAQDVARFCEVDLKTIHHWADRGRVAHHRTEGRHLRFRRNDVLRFLRAHAFPLPEELTTVRPQVALPPAPPGNEAESPEGWSLAPDDIARRLSGKFLVRRPPTVLAAVARLLVDGVDALVLSLDDPALGPGAVAALKSAPETAWVMLAVIGRGEALDRAKAEGAEIALSPSEVDRVSRELGKALAVAG